MSSYHENSLYHPHFHENPHITSYQPCQEAYSASYMQQNIGNPILVDTQQVPYVYQPPIPSQALW